MDKIIEGREVMLALSLLYKGNWDAIYQAMKRKDGVALEAGLKLLPYVKAKYVTILDEDYPDALYSHSYKPPFVLYYYGDIHIASDYTKILTVVGSRSPTAYTSQKTRELCKGMAEKGYVICSGLARGIDTIAGEATAPYVGKSIAVLGNGIDITYPMENIGLREKIAANGLVLSEYPGKTSPDARNFPMRNRILACLGQGVLVSEIKPHSGTYITASYALSYDRDLATIPFACGSGLCNNDLIKGGAALIETVNDLELFMDSIGSVKKYSKNFH